jgi:hypothetical protein
MSSRALSTNGRVRASRTSNSARGNPTTAQGSGSLQFRPINTGRQASSANVKQEDSKEKSHRGGNTSEQIPVASPPQQGESHPPRNPMAPKGRTAPSGQDEELSVSNASSDGEHDDDDSTPTNALSEDSDDGPAGEVDGYPTLAHENSIKSLIDAITWQIKKHIQDGKLEGYAELEGSSKAVVAAAVTATMRCVRQVCLDEGDIYVAMDAYTAIKSRATNLQWNIDDLSEQIAAQRRNRDGGGGDGGGGSGYGNGGRGGPLGGVCVRSRVLRTK